MALARALAVEPTVLLLDEPFGALDAKVRKELRDWLRRLHDEVHVTTVFVTHDQEEALEVADEIVVINDGRDRAGRHARRALRRAGQRLRDELPRPGHPARRRHAAAARHRRVARTPGSPARSRARSAGCCASASRCGSPSLTDDGEVVTVVMTRTLARSLGLEEGVQVWLTPATGAITVPAMRSVAG